MDNALAEVRLHGLKQGDEIQGKDYLLGEYGSEASRIRYGELIAKHAKQHCVKNGKPTTEFGILEPTVRPLNQLFGMTPAKATGPMSLKAERDKFIDSSRVRSSVNGGVNRIRRVFEHAAANELVDFSVLTRMKCVTPAPGRTAVALTPTRGP